MSTAPHAPAARPSATAPRCRDCAEGLDHCHGTFVAHEDGSWECTEPDCTGSPLGHAWTLSCSALGSQCCVPAALAG